MCKCSGKCGCNITQITKGDKGDTGDTGPSAAIGFSSVEAITLSSAYDFMATITQSGDYIIMLQGKYSSGAAGDITTELYKGVTAQSTNDNYEQRDSGVTGSITFTHTAKVTGLIVSNTVGYKISSTDIASTIDNASITLIKM